MRGGQQSSVVRSNGVQSVRRTFELLELLAERGPMGLSGLAVGSGLPLTTWAMPHLTRLVDDLGETANLAMLEGDEIVYVAQVPSRHSMRMFTEVGRRVRPHCTAVGKALLAQLADEQVEAIVRRTGMPVHTPNTITEPDQLAKELVSVRRQGYAIDDGEQEVGVRCVAVAVSDTATRIAISVSGPAPRMTTDMVRRAVPTLNRTAAALAADLAGAGQHQ